MQRISIYATVASLALIGFYSWPAGSTNDADAAVNQSVADGQAGRDLMGAIVAMSGTSSPFGKPLAPADDQNARIAQRKEYMAKDGIAMDEKYLRMNTADLSRLGNTGDALASLQLAQRYWYEPDHMSSEPGADFSDQPQAVALKLYTVAARGGAGFVPELIASRLYAMRSDPTEAAAWSMVADKFGSATHSTTGPVRSFSGLTYEQLDAANKRAIEIANSIGAAL